LGVKRHHSFVKVLNVILAYMANCTLSTYSV